MITKNTGILAISYFFLNALCKLEKRKSVTKIWQRAQNTN